MKQPASNQKLFDSTFSDRLGKLMNEKNITQEALAKILNLSRGAVQGYLDGKKPSHETIIQIADYFNVSVDWLIGREGAIKTIDEDVTRVCRYTGLSEDAVIHLHKIQQRMQLFINNRVDAEHKCGFYKDGGLDDNAFETLHDFIEFCPDASALDFLNMLITSPQFDEITYNYFLMVPETYASLDPSDARRFKSQYMGLQFANSLLFQKFYDEATPDRTNRLLHKGEKLIPTKFIQFIETGVLTIDKGEIDHMEWDNINGTTQVEHK